MNTDSVSTQAEAIARIVRETTGQELTREELEELHAKECRSHRRLPQLCLSVKAGDTVHRYEAPMTAAIIEGGRLWYMELACSSHSQAHAIMGALVEERAKAAWMVQWDDMPRDNWADKNAWIKVEPPEDPRIADTKLAVPGATDGRGIHHVAVLDKDADLIVAERGRDIWRKVRERMTCPTLEDWGEDLLAYILHADKLVKLGISNDGTPIARKALTFGLDENFKAYVLDKNAQALFDGLVSWYVRNKTGGLRATQHKAAA